MRDPRTLDVSISASPPRPIVMVHQPGIVGLTVTGSGLAEGGHTVQADWYTVRHYRRVLTRVRAFLFGIGEPPSSHIFIYSRLV